MISEINKFSLIKIKAKIAAKIGPVVKLIQLDIDSGIYDIAEYCIALDIKLRADLPNTTIIILLLYFLRSKLVLRTNFPNM